MEFKTKTHTFKLISADISEDVITATFLREKKTHSELLKIFKASDETETMYADEKELSGYTEFVSLWTQKSAGNEEDQELVAIVSLKKPDLTAEKLKAAITYLGIMNGNSEVTEVLNE